MSFWTTFTGTILFDYQVEDDIWLMEELINRYSDTNLLKGTEISYHRQVSNRQPFHEKYPKLTDNKKRETNASFKRQPNERLSTTIKAITLYSNKEDNTGLEFYQNEIKDVILGLHEIFPIKLATFVFEDYISSCSLTFLQGKFSE